MMEKNFPVEMLGDGLVTITKDQTILQAALAAGIPHYHACGGNAQCSTCRILVRGGAEQLSPVNEKEKNLRKRIRFPEDVRLACQAYVRGEGVKVHRMIRDETDIRLYIKEDTLADTSYIGEERKLALFFLDIRNFTPFVETYLPFDVIHIMRRLFAIFKLTIETNGGRIIETAGDGFYAVFGLETTINEAVKNALNAGFQIEKEIVNFNQNYMYKNFRHRFNVGIGLHTGKVIIGNIGIGINNNLTVTGLPVNIAARLQAATKQLNNSFVISEEAFEQSADQPPGIKKELHIKGVKDSITVHLIGNPYSTT
jgi:adenylate cyclase